MKKNASNRVGLQASCSLLLIIHMLPSNKNAEEMRVLSRCNAVFPVTNLRSKEGQGGKSPEHCNHILSCGNSNLGLSRYDVATLIQTGHKIQVVI
jgi:hypothetical protein